MSNEIEYPVYRKNGCHFWKVYSDSECIKVLSTDWGLSITTCHKGNAYVSGAKDCLEAEFLEAYYEVRRKLDSLCLIQIDK